MRRCQVGSRAHADETTTFANKLADRLAAALAELPALFSAAAAGMDDDIETVQLAVANSLSGHSFNHDAFDGFNRGDQIVDAATGAGVVVDRDIEFRRTFVRLCFICRSSTDGPP